MEVRKPEFWIDSDHSLVSLLSIDCRTRYCISKGDILSLWPEKTHQILLPDYYNFQRFWVSIISD